MNHRPAYCLVTFLLLAGVCYGATFDLYGISFGSTPTPLYLIDRDTGTASAACETGIFGAGLAFDTNRWLFYASDPAADRLYAIAPATCAATMLLSGFHLNGLAYDMHADKIYAVANGVGTATLYQIDATTLSMEDLGDPGIGTVYSLAYHPIQRKLYAIGAQGVSGGGHFVQLNDPEDLSDQTFIAQLTDQGVELVQALTYDTPSGLFFAFASNAPFRSLITIDPESGSVETVGALGIGNGSVHGLAIIPEADCDGDGLYDDQDNDIDDDGVLNEADACDYTPPGANIVTDPGNPLYGTLEGDLDGDCDVDLADYAIAQNNLTGPGCWEGY